MQFSQFPKFESPAAFLEFLNNFIKEVSQNIRSNVVIKQEVKEEVLQIETQTKPQTEPQTEPKTKLKLEPKLEPNAEPKPEKKPEPKSLAKAEVKLEPKLETKSEPKPETKPKPKPLKKPEIKSEPKSKSESESEPETKPKPKPKPLKKPEIKSEPKSQSESESEPESSPEPNPEPKSEPKSEPDSLYNMYIKSEAMEPKLEQKLEPEPESMQRLVPVVQPQVGVDKFFRAEIDKMMNFLLLKMAKNDQQEIQEFRQIYIHAPCLLQIFDKLVMKYFSAKKCKEDMVRYVLRKALKVIKSSIMSKEKVSSQKAWLILCKKYFQNTFDEVRKSKGNTENDDELLELLLPYNKKSKNKTINSAFIAEVFSSEDFRKEYEQFLTKFSSILNADNSWKREKFIKFLMQCIKTGSTSKVANYKRFPWLDSWIEDTKTVANGLMKTQKSEILLKKCKNY